MIEPDLAELVDDHDRAGERLILQQAVEERRLAGAEEAGEHGEGNGLGGLAQVVAGAHFFLASVFGSGLCRSGPWCRVCCGGLRRGRLRRGCGRRGWPCARSWVAAAATAPSRRPIVKQARGHRRPSSRRSRFLSCCLWARRRWPASWRGQGAPAQAHPGEPPAAAEPACCQARAAPTGTPNRPNRMTTAGSRWRLNRPRPRSPVSCGACRTCPRADWAARR